METTHQEDIDGPDPRLEDDSSDVPGDWLGSDESYWVYIDKEE